MITLTREEAQQVLDALEYNQANWQGKDKAIDTLRARLAQPEPVPVAWMRDCANFWWQYTLVNEIAQEQLDAEAMNWIEKLRTPSLQREWQGLTDYEIKEILDCGRPNLVNIKKAEQKLKDKNT